MASYTCISSDIVLNISDFKGLLVSQIYVYSHSANYIPCIQQVLSEILIFAISIRCRLLVDFNSTCSYIYTLV